MLEELLTPHLTLFCCAKILNFKSEFAILCNRIYWLLLIKVRGIKLYRLQNKLIFSAKHLMHLTSAKLSETIPYANYYCTV